jgi:serine/threonine protein kinase
VLDFGLAKAVDLGSDHADPLGETVAHPTTAGTILGTAAYMAPEQAKGLDVDRRADLWAFGCVLFEMLAGRQPFEANSVSGLLVKVVHDAPDWDVLPATTPSAVRALLRRCLEKDPRQRLDSASVARIEIDQAIAAAISREARDSGADQSAVDISAPSSRRDKQKRHVWLITLAAAVAVAVVVLWLTIGRAGSSADAVPRLQNPLQVTASLGVESSPTWSPDGARIVYEASEGGYGGERDHDIWVSQVGSGDPINLTNGAGDNRMPSWSPDGREIAFFSNRSGTWAVYTAPAIGGRPRQVLQVSGIDATHWSAPQWSSCSCCPRFRRRASNCPIMKEPSSGT